MSPCSTTPYIKHRETVNTLRPPTLSSAQSVAPAHPHRDETGYAEKFDAVARNASVSRRVVPPSFQPVAEAEPFDFVYQHPRLVRRPDREWVPVVGEFRGNWDLYARQGDSVRYIVRLNQVDFTRAEAMEVCRLLVDALNRWPDMDAMSKLGCRRSPPAKLENLLCRAAIQKALPDKPIPLNPPTGPQRFAHDGFRFRYYLPVLDTNSLELTTPHIATAVAKFDSPSVSIPEAENVIWCEGARLLQDSETPRPPSPATPLLTETFDNALPPGTRECMRRAELFARYIAAHISRHYSPVMSASDVYSIANYQFHQLGCGRLPHSYCYDGNSALFVSRQHMTVLFELPRLICRDIGIKTFKFGVRSPDMAFAMVVLDAVVDEWLSSGDVIEAFRKATTTTDAVNRRIGRGEPSPNRCNCSAQQRATTHHHCGKCGCLAPCWDLTDHSDGFRACATCHLSSDAVRSAFFNAWYSARVSAYSDASSGGKDQAWLDHVRKGLYEDLERLLQRGNGSEFVNGYSGRLMPGNIGMKHPLNLSVDAIFPIYVSDTGGVYYHHAGNISLVPHVVNCMKGMHLPIWLSTVSRYCADITPIMQRRRRGSIVAADEFRARQNTIIGDCHRFCQVSRRVPYRVAARLGLRLDSDMWRYLHLEMVAGRLHRGSSPPPQARQLHNVYSNASRLQTVRVMSIIEEIEARTEVSLERQMGCPFFLDGPIPPNWNWGLCVWFISDRLGRMKRHCNKKFETVDTSETIFLECVLQTSIKRMVVRDDDPDAKLKRDLQDKYAEFHQLPIVLESRNPLTMSIGKRHHNNQMVTGWPLCPTSLQQRLDADARNNILIESWASNFSKLDFAESTYPTIKQAVLDIDMPLSIANPDLDVGECDPVMEEKLAKALRDAGDETGADE